MNVKLPTQLEKLHRAAEVAAIQFKSYADGVFDPCGLILEVPPIEESYWCTPKNVVTFARTGGDGVHYSYFKDFESLNGAVPIVMTMPSAGTNNVVIAESFEEFFNLGYYVGWFCLEQVVYDENWAIEYFSKIDEEQRDYSEDRLSFLRSALNIQPVPPNMGRLSALKEKYFGMLEIAESLE